MALVQELLRNEITDHLIWLDCWLEVLVSGGILLTLNFEAGVDLLQVVLNVSLHSQICNCDGALTEVLLLHPHVFRAVDLSDDVA